MSSDLARPSVTTDLARQESSTATDRPRQHIHRGGPLRFGIAEVLALLMSLFLILPMIGLIQRAMVNGGLLDAIRRPIVYEAVRLSILTTIAVLLLTLVFGSALGLVLARRRFRGI